MKLHLLPFLDIAEADAVVERFHRHLDPLDRPQKLAIGAADEGGGVRGVIVVGTPAARPLDDGFTYEARRLASDGSPMVCSLLYAAAMRALAAAGARRFLTYTLASEPGTSLVASGFYLARSNLDPVNPENLRDYSPAAKRLAFVRGRHWGCPSRPRDREVDLFGDAPRIALVEAEDKLRWAVQLDGTRRRRR